MTARTPEEYTAGFQALLADAEPFHPLQAATLAWLIGQAIQQDLPRHVPLDVTRPAKAWFRALTQEQVEAIVEAAEPGMERAVAVAVHWWCLDRGLLSPLAAIRGIQRLYEAAG